MDIFSEKECKEELAEEFSCIDKDSCSKEEINDQFSNRYIEVSCCKVTKGDVFCSKLLAGSNPGNSVASVLSDKSVAVIDLSTFKTKELFKPHKKEITEIRFSPISYNLIYTSSLDGKVNIWDLRSNCVEKVLCMSDSEETIKPLTTFDISSQERLVCGGTELVGEDSFLLFWDLRGEKLLGGYWESHSDDITCIRFNPSQPETLASAGCDGLLNVFDVSQTSEDDALTYCLNTEDIINTFSWSGEQKKKEILAYTDIQSIQIWDVEESKPSLSFSRENITKSLKRIVPYECYSVPIHYESFSKNPIILAASGLEHEGNSCLRSLKVNERNGILEPHGLFVCQNDKEMSSITQVALSLSDSEDIITAREDGIVSLWKKKQYNSEGYKVMKCREREKIKPY